MVDQPILQVVEALALHTEAVAAVAERSIAAERLLVAEAIVVVQAVVVAAARSIAEIATAQPATAAHLTSATRITPSVAHQAMAVALEAIVVAASPLAVVTVAARVDDSLVRKVYNIEKSANRYEKDYISTLLTTARLWSGKGSI